MDNFQLKVIKASAGTGKTYRLALEYVNILIQNKELNFAEILVITFTKKATAEIRERIMDFLAILLDNNKNVDLKRSYEKLFSYKLEQTDLTYLKTVYEKLLSEKDKFRILTIDAFINNIFRHLICPYLFINDYQIDDNVNEKYLPDIYHFLFQEIVKGNDIDLTSFFQENTPKNLEFYNKFITQLIDYRWLLQESDYLASTEQESEILLQKLILTVRQIAQTLQSYANLTEKLFKTEYKSFFKDLIDSNFYEFEENFVKAILVLKHQKKLKNLLAQELWCKPQVKGAGKDVLEKLFPIFKSQIADYLFITQVIPEHNQLMNISKKLYQKYDEIKFTNKVFTHQDILFYTFKYLYNKDYSLVDENNIIQNQFYLFLSNKIRYMLIDEFQDTSILQYKILYPIINEIISGYGSQDYGGIIAVGDEKQAIYGWRGGERDLLLRLRNILNLADFQFLNRSFRSRTNIVNFVNNLMQHVSTTFQSAGYNYPYLSMETNLTDTHPGLVKIILSPDSDDSDPPITNAQIFVEQLLPYIQQESNLSNIAILGRTNNDLTTIAGLLEERKIPYLLDTSKSIVYHRSIKPIILLLRAIAYQTSFELLEFLRSDLILLDNTELRELLVQNDLDITFHGLISKTSPDLKLILESLLESYTHTPLLDFVQIILDKFEYYHKFPSQNDILNIETFLNIIKKYTDAKMFTENEYQNSFTGFLQYLENVQNNYPQIGINTENAVKLLTIHKSKGLEFPTVCLFLNLNTRNSYSDEISFYYDFDEHYYKTNYAIMTFHHSAIMKELSDRAISNNFLQRNYIEDINTLYVALTRAKDNLLVYLPKATLTNSKYSFHLNNTFLNFLNLEKSLFDQINPGTYTAGTYFTKTSTVNQSVTIDSDLHIIAQEKVIKPADEAEVLSQARLQKIFLGNIIHEVLSKCYHIQDIQVENISKLLNHYTHKLSPVNLSEIKTKLLHYTVKHQHLYDETNWNIVYNEFDIISADDHFFRLDKLLISHARKEILIVDYKTGTNYDLDQLVNYKKILHSLDLVNQANYTVKTEIIELLD